MEFVQWALEKAVNHPNLSDAIVSADGEWLEILLPDGRTFRFRPGALIAEDAPEAERSELLYRLISIGVAQAKAPSVHRSGDAANAEGAAADDESTVSGSTLPADVEKTQKKTDRKPELTRETASYPTSLLSDRMADHSTIVPIVRAADYFVNSHQGEDSMIYVPLTDFVGVGLALDLPDAIQPLYYSHVEQAPSDVGGLLAESVNALRRLVGHQHLSVDLGLSKISGAEVITFLAPDNYELSWFCDVEMMMEVAQRLQERHPNDIPLFVPAARTKFYVVFSEDPHLVDFFKILLAQRRSPEAVYPLPHTVAADGWKEWVPFPGSALAQVLGTLRDNFRQAIYDAQMKVLPQWGDFGELKSFVPRRLHSGERVSATEWNAMDVRGSIPDTDFISFIREPSPHPWENPNGVRITIRSRVAREIWPQGIAPDPAAWPPRWNVRGFPDEATLSRLAESADRDF